MQLTIAIPTYNRNELLRTNLAKLLPQLTAECRLLILDNHSPQPVREALADLLQQFPSLDVRIVRHAANVGGDANALRCFELCETPWLWLLADDDEPLPDSVPTLFALMEQYPDAVYFNCATEAYLRPTTITGHSVESLLSHFDSINNILLISTCLFRADRLRRFLCEGFYFGTGGWPHFVMALLCLKESGEFCFSHRQIVHYVAPPAERFWSYIDFVLRFSACIDLPLPYDLRRRLGEIVAGAIYPIAVLAVLATKTQLGMIEHETAVYITDQICQRGLYFDVSFKRRLEGWLAQLLIRFPRLAMVVVRMVYRAVHFKSVYEDPKFLYTLGREGVVVEDGLPMRRG